MILQLRFVGGQVEPPVGYDDVLNLVVFVLRFAQVVAFGAEAPGSDAFSAVGNVVA